jgi:glutamine cyclotransferase
MADLDPRRALEATDGDLPDPEFVESLRQTLEVELAAQSDGTRTVTSDLPVIDAVLQPDDEEQGMSNNQKVMALVGAVAAVVIVVVGLIVISDDATDETELDTVDQPDTGDAGDEAAGEDVADTPPPPTTEAPTTAPIEPPPSWEFDITYIDVPAGNSVAANGDFAWVASAAPPVLSKIDLTTNTVVSTYEIPPGARGTHFGFDAVWIRHDDGTVSRFDPETETITATIDVGGVPAWLEAGDDSVWQSNGIAGQAVRIDPATNEVVARVDIGEPTGAIKENPTGVWIRTTAGAVIRIDPATNTIVATIDTPGGGGSLMAGPDAVWAPGGANGLVYRIDPGTNAISAEVDISAAVGETVVMFGIHFVGDTVWVRYAYNCVDGTCTDGVARINPETNAVVAFADLRADWGQSGMSVGPTTAWTFDDDTIARFDF